MKKILSAVLILGMVLCFAACGADEAKTQGSTLVYGSTDYTAINPALYEHCEINLLLFLGLTAHDGENNIVPAAAESWKWDGAANTYTFTLRDGLVFHDGHPLTAKDVKYTIEAIKNPDNGSENASNFEDVVGVTVLDDLHVAIELEAPNVAMLDYLTIGILPAHLLEGKDLVTDDFNRNPVGAGPYKLVSWDMGQSIILEKFDDFYLGAPEIDNVIFKIVDDSDTRALQLESGELDFAQITPKTMGKFEKLDGYRVYKMDTADYRGIMYNFNSDFFSKYPELPGILSYGVDREAIVDSVLLGHGQTAYSPLQKGSYNNPGIEKFEYNPDLCRTLLEEDGWKKGEDGYYYKNGDQLAFKICNGQADQVRIDMSNICAQNFREIGINAVVDIVAETDWEKQDAYLIGWGSPFDPDDHTYKVFGTGQGANYNYYSNENVDSLLKQARELETYEERLPLYQEFQEELTKDLPYTFIAYIDAIYAGKDTIHGITEDTVLGHHGVGIFWNIYDWTIE